VCVAERKGGSNILGGDGEELTGEKSDKERESRDEGDEVGESSVDGAEKVDDGTGDCGIQRFNEASFRGRSTASSWGGQEGGERTNRQKQSSRLCQLL
jgi:hypothetical protein